MTALLEGQYALPLFDEVEAAPPTARYDLPPLWDGVPIAWGAWKRIDTTLVLHLHAEHFACEKCGAVDEQDIAHGRRGQLINLRACRCRHCGHDQVTDLLTGTCWDLDDTDYADIGSTEPPSTKE